jgi:hypothetical protein
MLPRPAPLGECRSDETTNKPPDMLDRPDNKLPANNPHVGTYNHAGLTTFYPSYLYYAAHSPYLPLLRHSAPTAPIARIVHEMMRARYDNSDECCGEDWVVVESDKE